MEKQIIMVPIDEIQAHPEQTKIYGPTEADEEFIASIADKGVLQPVLLADVKLLGKEFKEKGKKYFLVAGHRRHLGSKLAGLAEVPAMVREYTDYDETCIHMVISNMQRIKSERQMVQEYLSIKQKLCQVGKNRMSKGVYDKTLLVDDEITRFMEALNIDLEKPINTADIIRDKLGYSEYKQQMWNWLYDADTKEKVLKQLYKNKCPQKSIEVLCDNWEECTKAHDDKKTSLYDAVETIKGQVEKLKKYLNGDKKAFNKKQTKSKKEKSEEPDEMSYDELVDGLFEPLELKKGMDFVEYGATSESNHGWVINKGAGDGVHSVVGVYVDNGTKMYKVNKNALCRIFETWLNS